LLVKVLGAGAGGGFPQWNCNTRLSRLAWDGDDRVIPRTQSSIAVSADGKRWVIVNASPDIRQQIWATPELQPDRKGGLRNSPIAAVILTNGDIDHVAGLLSLRERQPFSVYATPRVLWVLEENSVFRILAPDVVSRLRLPLNEAFEIAGTGIVAEAFPVHGKVALYLEDPSKEGFGTETGDTIGLRLTSPGSGTLFYIPGCAKIDDELLSRVKRADALLLDGTLFTDNEVIELGVLDKTSLRMGHVPITGEGGSLRAFDGARIAKKAYIHINTTNPILEKGSEAEKTVKSAGWEVSYDGMTIEV
jgi:pyrroloquinoline quinone biosynthesis protein B